MQRLATSAVGAAEATGAPRHVVTVRSAESLASDESRARVIGLSGYSREDRKADATSRRKSKPLICSSPREGARFTRSGPPTQTPPGQRAPGLLGTGGLGTEAFSCHETRQPASLASRKTTCESQDWPKLLRSQWLRELAHDRTSTQSGNF